MKCTRCISIDCLVQFRFFDGRLVKCINYRPTLQRLYLHSLDASICFNKYKAIRARINYYIYIYAACACNFTSGVPGSGIQVACVDIFAFHVEIASTINVMAQCAASNARFTSICYPAPKIVSTSSSSMRDRRCAQARGGELHFGLRGEFYLKTKPHV